MSRRRSIPRSSVQSGVQSAVQVSPSSWPMRGPYLGPVRDAEHPIPFALVDSPISFVPIEERCAEVDPRDLTP